MSPWQRIAKPIGAAPLVPGPEQPADPLGGGEVFLAEITAVSGTGTSAKYGFKEVNVATPSGATQDRVSGRVGTTTDNPARFAGSGTLAVGDRVLVRRNVADVNEYEILPGGGGDSTFLVLLTEKSYAATFIKYSAVEVEASGSLTYAVKAGGRTFSTAGTPLYHEEDISWPVVGLTAGSPRFVKKHSVVRVFYNPNGFWYFKGHPWRGIFRRTGTTDADGEQAYHRINTANTGLTWGDRTEVRLIEAE